MSDKRGRKDKSDDHGQGKLNDKSKSKGVQNHEHDFKTLRSIGIHALIPQPDKRTRVDNLGNIHEYPTANVREKHQEKLAKRLESSGKTIRASIAKLIQAKDDVKIVVPQNPYGGSPRKSPVFNKDEFILEAPITVAALLKTTHLFFQRLSSPLPESFGSGSGDSDTPLKDVKTSDLKELVNESEQPIFYLLQTRSTNFLLFLILWGFIRQQYEFVVIDKNGKFALIVNGVQYLCGIYSKSKIFWGDGRPIGKLYQSFCGVTYIIQDEESKDVFTIIGPVFAIYAPCVFGCCDESFEIFHHETADEVSRIGKYWDETSFIRSHTGFGVNFQMNLTIWSKSLLLGAAIAIRYQYFLKGGNGVLVVFLYLVVASAVGGVVFHFFACFGYCPKRHS